MLAASAAKNSCGIPFSKVLDSTHADLQYSLFDNLNEVRGTAIVSL
jgi:hypothetical protein